MTLLSKLHCFAVYFAVCISQGGHIPLQARPFSGVYRIGLVISLLRLLTLPSLNTACRWLSHAPRASSACRHSRMLSRRTLKSCSCLFVHLVPLALSTQAAVLFLSTPNRAQADAPVTICSATWLPTPSHCIHLVQIDRRISFSPEYLHTLSL